MDVYQLSRISKRRGVRLQVVTSDLDVTIGNSVSIPETEEFFWWIYRSWSPNFSKGAMITQNLAYGPIESFTDGT